LSFFQTIDRLQKQSSKLQDNEIEIQQLRETLGDYNVQVKIKAILDAQIIFRQIANWSNIKLE
jgi:ribosomal protein L9